MAIGGGAIRAGRAFVELFAEPNKLYRALDAAKKRVLDFAKISAKIGVGAAGLGGAVLGPITKFFTDAVKEGAGVENLASKFNSTAESISTLKGAFLQAGISGDQFETILDGLSEKISHAADKNDFLVESLQSIGRGRDLIGKDVGEQLDIILERLSKIPDAQDRIRAANELGLASFIPYLKQGKAGLDALRQAAKDNGLVMSGEDAKAAKEIFKEFNSVSIALKSTLISIGKALLPTGKDFSSVGKDIRAALGDVRAWIADHKQVVVVIAAVAAGLVAGGAAFVGIGTAIAIVAPAVTGLIIAMKAVAAVIAFLVSPLGLVLVAVTAVAAGFAYLFAQTETGKGVIAELTDGFSQFFSFLKGSWQGVSDALKAGDWSLAFDIAVKTAEVTWTGFVFGITAAWTDFKGTFVDTWRDATSWLAKNLTDLGAFILRNTVGTLRDMIEAFNSVAPKSLKIGIYGILDDNQINEARDAIKGQIDRDREAEQKASNKYRDKQTESALEEWQRAQKELDDLKKRAAQEAADAGKGEGAWARLGDFARKYGKEVKPDQSLPSTAQLFANQKGIFGGNAQQQLGYGDNIAQRQLDATTTIAGNTTKTNTILNDLKNKPGEVWGA